MRGFGGTVFNSSKLPNGPGKGFGGPVYNSGELPNGPGKGFGETVRGFGALFSTVASFQTAKENVLGALVKVLGAPLEVLVATFPAVPSFQMV